MVHELYEETRSRLLEAESRYNAEAKAIARDIYRRAVVPFCERHKLSFNAAACAFNLSPSELATEIQDLWELIELSPEGGVELYYEMPDYPNERRRPGQLDVVLAVGLSSGRWEKYRACIDDPESEDLIEATAIAYARAQLSRALDLEEATFFTMLHWEHVQEEE